MELGRERSESRPSVFTIRDFYSRQGRRAVIQLGFCVLANSRVRWYGNDRFDASLFSPLAKISGYTVYIYAGKNHLYNYRQRDL